MIAGVVHLQRSDHWILRVSLCQLWFWWCTAEATRMWNG